MILEFNRTKEKLLVLSWIFITKTKRFQIAQEFFKDKTKLLVVPKKMLVTEQNRSFRIKKFWELIKNFSFRSRILFKKRIHLIFFGTKAAKRKLPILKERWFDIATTISLVRNLSNHFKHPMLNLNSFLGTNPGLAIVPPKDIYIP